MLLYHHSNSFYSKLKKVSKDGIWFTTAPDGYTGQEKLFRYHVDICVDDSKLHEQRHIGNGNKGAFRWYTYDVEELEYDKVLCRNWEFAPLLEQIQKFRCMIERTDFATIPEAGCFCKFPKGCCDDTALLLWKFLQKKFCGKYDSDIAHRSGMSGRQSHAWLEYKGFIIIDITADQFPDIEESVVITMDSKDKKWYKQFINNASDDGDITFDNRNERIKKRLTELMDAICKNDN